jgi:hypothetical protein
VTLLVNYWKDRKAGEAFTLTLPQEDEYLNHYYRLKEQIKRERRTGGCDGVKCHHQLTEVIDRSVTISDHVKTVKPSPSLLEIPIGRSFDDDITSWLNQTFPSVYMQAIVDNYPSFVYDDGLRSFGWLHSDWRTTPQTSRFIGQLPGAKKLRFNMKAVPAVLFKLNQSQVVEQYKSKKIHIHYWNHWKLNEVDGTYTMTIVSTNNSAVDEWRRSMPGGDPFLSINIL